MNEIKQKSITYHPDKRPFYEKVAPAGEHYACAPCGKWIKVEEWEEHKKLHYSEGRAIKVPKSL